MIKEIINELANSVLDILPKNEAFQYIVLKIKRLEDNVGFQGFYFDEQGIRKSLSIWDFNFNSDRIHELYKITTEQPPKHKNWNRADFTIYSDGRFNMEYIWDQQLQDEVDKYNNDAKSGLL